MFTLDDILGLVGTLDDGAGADTPRERFRRFLRDSVRTTGALRDYVEACIRGRGAQYDHALQDLVNHAAALIGFDVEFGRYRGVSGETGHDGLWCWNDFSIVAEVKTTDAFAIRTATVVGYVDRLISEGRIPDWDHAMGLYVVARPDAELAQLANSIVAERRTQQLRIATVETVLSLVELVQDRHITPDEAVALLRPTGVYVADTVRLLARIAAGVPLVPEPTPHEEQTAERPGPTGGMEGAAASEPRRPPAPRTRATTPETRMHLLMPVADDPDSSARETIERLLGAGWYVFCDKTPGRARLRPSDRLCFDQSGVGVVAEAEVAGEAERKPPPVKGLVRNVEKFPWSFPVRGVRYFFDAPVVIDADLRARMEAFADRRPDASWSWLVQGTRSVSEHDFEVLVGRSPA